MPRLTHSIVVGVVISLWALPSAAQPSADRARSLLTPGQQVKVEGINVSGLFRARVVAVRDLDPSSKVEGLVELASADRRTLQVNGFQVVLDSSTRIYRGDQITKNRSLLTAGAWLEAKGTWRDGAIKASRIRVKDAAEPTAEIEGPVATFDSASSTLTLLERRILLDTDARVVDERSGVAIAGTPTTRLRRDDDDGQSEVPLRFGSTILGGRVEGGFQNEQNYETPARADHFGTSRVQLIGSSQFNERLEAYVKTTFDSSVGRVASGDLRVSEAYLQVNDIASLPLSLQIGRQRFRDSREWLFDEYLDAVRLHATLPRVKLEGAIAHGMFSGPEVQRARRDQLQAIGSATGRVGAVRWGAHVITRRDENRGERPTWIAGLIDGSGEYDAYWINAAMRRGVAGDTQLRGWTFDLGVRHTAVHDWRPTMTIGYAFASGDSTRSDLVDSRYRQTGLQDNQSYFGGLRRIAIYGELFDPELSNLHVWTGAFGIQPRRGLAIDTVFHEYMQPVLSGSLPSSNLDGALTGLTRRVGREIDFLLTLRARRGIDVDLAVGFFQRGPAFASNSTPAFFWRPQVRFYF